MDDPILTSRLLALHDHLQVVKDNLQSEAWEPRIEQPNTRTELRGGSSMWDALKNPLTFEIRRRQAVLDDLMQSLAGAEMADHNALFDAWAKYTGTLRDSRDLMRECLEIIGTLAIRNNNLDRNILYVADQLILECLYLSYGKQDYYLLVHGLEDTLPETRARIIRLRFPEWTIWDLPLAAHELGHVWLTRFPAELGAEYKETLANMLDRQRQSLVELGGSALGDKKLEGEGSAERRVRVLVADAFATYTMGPAYACSNIMLRLNPSAGPESNGTFDEQRMQVIMSMLNWMNQISPVSMPFETVVRLLNQHWMDSSRYVDPSRERNKVQSRYASELVEEFTHRIRRVALLENALYSVKDWNRARELSGMLWDELEGQTQLGWKGRRLRDVVNATWNCRLDKGIKDWDQLRNLADAAEKLCNSIIAAPSGPRRVPSSTTTRASPQS